MPKRTNPRRYRKAPGRRVWVFSELNPDLRPEPLARIITAAGLEQAKQDADATTPAAADGCSGDNTGKENDHA